MEMLLECRGPVLLHGVLVTMHIVPIDKIPSILLNLRQVVVIIRFLHILFCVLLSLLPDTDLETQISMHRQHA